MVEDAPHGISMARYAAVAAAVAEPFPRGRVLALEEIGPGDFAAAEIAWKKRLARRDGVDFARYAEELAAAEDWLLRRVTPLYQEPAAWAAFLAAMRLDPGRVLKVTGLGKNDFARLSRHWTRLAEEDGGIAADIADHLAAGPTELPRVVAEPRQLRRSRAFPGPSRSRASPQPGAPSVAAVAPVLEPEPVVAPAIAIATPSAAEEHGTAALPAVGFLHKAPVVPFRPAASEEHGTAALPAVRIPGAALPFQARVAEEHGTAALPAIPAGRPALPFGEAAEPERGAPALGAAPLPFAQRAGEEHGTAALPAIQAPRAALPFAAKTQEEHGTAALPAIQAPRAALPFAAKAQEEHGTAALPAIPAFTLEQYASLCVDLGRDPARRAETLARYRLSEAQQAALDAAWRARFAGDPRARAAFEQAAAVYRSWLAGLAR